MKTKAWQLSSLLIQIFVFESSKLEEKVPTDNLVLHSGLRVRLSSHVEKSSLCVWMEATQNSVFEHTLVLIDGQLLLEQLNSYWYSKTVSKSGAVTLPLWALKVEYLFFTKIL